MIPRRERITFQSVEGLNNYINKYDRAGKLGSEFVVYLVEFSSALHPSDAYKFIKSVVNVKKDKDILGCKRDNPGVYQEFQDYYYNECKAMFDHDNAFATNYDVDVAVTKSYGILLRMLSNTVKSSDSRFTKLLSAINTIEDKLELDRTNLEEEENDNSNGVDVQGD